MWFIVVLCVLCASSVARAGGAGYGFYRNMRGASSGASTSGGRRVFGGQSATLNAYGATCALLDRYWTARCSGAVLAPRWALTAAHCVSPHVAYVKYNSRRPAAAEGALAPVHYLYRHPEYRVQQRDEGRGVDVTLLHHDVGLVRTKQDMRLATPPPTPPLAALRRYSPQELSGREVQVLGFGRTESGALGEELFEVRLSVSGCGRATWVSCVCGAAESPVMARGVCAGDSGGPVLLGGALVALTSMGPLECSGSRDSPPEDSTSVFTALQPYADLINATINDTEAALRMDLVSSASTIYHTLNGCCVFVLLLLVPWLLVTVLNAG